MKICVYAIMKNESWCIERFLQHAIGADHIIIGDTGSSEDELLKCQQILDQYSHAEIIDIAVVPWRFDVARDTVLSLIPRDVDICISLDLDECLQPGWRKEIERVWVPGTTRLNYMFDWGAGIAFWYDKIHARNGYKWKNPVHEFPMPFGIEEKYASTSPDFLLNIHKPDSSKSRAQYMPMLEMSVREDPWEPKNAFYYARELSFYDKFEESITECKRYLALPRATWKTERSYAYRTIGRCHQQLGRHAEAEEAFLMSAAESPGSREPWCELAQVAYAKSEWPSCLALATRCLEIRVRELSYTVDPEVWGFKPHMWASIAAWNMKLFPLAFQHAETALNLSPDDKLLQSNYGFCKHSLEQEKCPVSTNAEPTPLAKKITQSSLPRAQRKRRSAGK